MVAVCCRHFQSLGVWAGLLIGTILLAIAIIGSRKAVFALLYAGWV
ncbi:MAG: hypothetical protein HT580_11285 [Dechloromonas sp.]|nr:MAG: hypothetical protein HT580_11285 [Dechloromonas sp.]